MHFHGMTQNGNPWYDGVPGVGQCPIASGQRLKYRFRADRYGTTWYADPPFNLSAKSVLTNSGTTLTIPLNIRLECKGR